MPWEQWRRKRYEDEVLASARSSGRLPEDLFVRYGIDDDLKRRLRADDAAFQAHTAEVCKYWRGLQQRRTHKRIAVDLVSAHERLAQEGELTFTAFKRRSRDASERITREWRRISGDLTTAVIDRSEFADLLAQVGGTRKQAEEALGRHGVRVVEELPDLPLEAPSAQASALARSLGTRGAAFSPEVVFGADRLRAGFTVLRGLRLADGARPDDAALDTAARRIEVEAMTEGKAAAETVLGILRAAGGEPERSAIALWEIAQDLRRQPPALAASGLARRWTERGLDEREAAVVAAAVRAEAATPAERAEREVRDLLAAGLLHRAQEAALALPSDHDLHHRVRERADRLTDLVGRAHRALEGGRREEAAGALFEAARLDGEEGLEDQAAAVPPLPAERVRARADGRRTVVTWEPSRSRAGAIGYRVLRRTGRGGAQALVAETSGTEAADDGAPVGVELRYSVVAVRSGSGRAPEAPGPALTLAPDVDGLRIGADESAVTAEWTPPSEAAHVEVLRGEGAPPKGVGDGVPVPAGGSGFRDTGVRPGRHYFYRVRVVYRSPGGRAASSPGIVREARPLHRPDPVADLEVHALPAGGHMAVWTPPARGEVSLRCGPAPPDWPAGARVTAAELEGYGPELLRGGGAGPDGRARMEVALPAGGHYLLAATLSGERAAVGSAVRADVAAPVSALRAERFDDRVRLGWEWPERATAALVEWAGQDGSSGRERCSRLRYESDGGFEASMGHTALEVRVRALVPADGGPLTASPVTAAVPAAAVLDYSVSVVGPLRRHRRIRVRAPRGCDMPEILVVHARGTVQPYSPDQGDVLARIPPRRLEPGGEAHVRVRLPAAAGPGWLVCFRSGEERSVHLRQPPVKELRIR